MNTFQGCCRRQNIAYRNYSVASGPNHPDYNVSDAHKLRPVYTNLASFQEKNKFKTIDIKNFFTYRIPQFVKNKEENMKKTALAVAAVLAMAWLIPATGFTTAEIGKKEGGAPCTKCHVKPLKGDENLNDVGKCYKEKKDLKACEKK